MKKLLFIAAAACLLASCGNSGNNKVSGNEQENSARSEVVVYKLDDLLTEADNLIGKTVTVRGFVTHTCKHSGKRCFIVGDSQKTSFRVEAKGNIGGFNRELIGSELDITGVVRERRLSQEYLEQMGKELVDQKLKENISGETCDAELANVKEMKAWMKENGKDYYAIYYMDGEEFEIVEE